MINDKRLFNIGDQIFCFLSSSSNPNILIPIKGIVKDIKHDLNNPRYKVKIEKFYDTWPFIKKYFFDNYYTYSFKDRPRPCKIKDKNISNLEELIEKIQNSDNNDRYYIVIESLMSFKFYNEMIESFNNIQDFLAHKMLKDTLEFQTRTFYKGKYKIQTKKEWFIKARNLINDSISDQEYKKIINDF